MSVADFDTLPDGARLWIFGADRELDEPAAARLRDRMRRFLKGWTAHRRELRAAFQLRHGRFLLVAADDRRTPASGCSIDALLRQLKELEEELEIRLLDGARVWFRQGEGIACVGREEFRELAAEGVVDGATPVFDLTLDRLADLRTGRFEVEARDSWHAALLGFRAARRGGRPPDGGGGALR